MTGENDQAADALGEWLGLERHVAEQIVAIVKRAQIEGAEGELCRQEWFDDARAETEEHLPEEALLEFAHNETAKALRPLYRATLARAAAPPDSPAMD